VSWKQLSLIRNVLTDLLTTDGIWDPYISCVLEGWFLPIGHTSVNMFLDWPMTPTGTINYRNMAHTHTRTHTWEAQWRTKTRTKDFLDTHISCRSLWSWPREATGGGGGGEIQNSALRTGPWRAATPHHSTETPDERRAPPGPEGVAYLRLTNKRSVQLIIKPRLPIKHSFLFINKKIKAAWDFSMSISKEVTNTRFEVGAWNLGLPIDVNDAQV